MTPEDLREMTRRHHQEHLLHAHGFEPVLPDGRELWTRGYELYTRGRALVVVLEELAATDRGSRSFTDSLIKFSQDDERGSEC